MGYPPASMLLLYLLVVLPALALAIAASVASTARDSTAEGTSVFGAWSSLALSVGLMACPILGATVTHGGSGRTFTYALVVTSAVLGLLCAYLSIQAMRHPSEQSADSSAPITPPAAGPRDASPDDAA